MKKAKLFGLALVATIMGASFSACNNDAEEVLAQESEIKLTSEITPSRVTSDLQSTQIVEGQQVGVTITGAKSEHKNVAWTAGANGALSNSGDAIYYGNGTATITAYHPYNASWIGTSQTFSVNTDQSTNIGYLASDLLWVTKTATKSEEAIALTFAHKLAKINVTLVPEYKEMDLSEATISICNTKTSTTIDLSDGTVPTEATGEVQEIIAGTGTTASAIIAPQAIAANTKFIKVELGEKTFYYTLNVDKELKSGYSHNYTLTVKEAALEITNSSEIEDWDNSDNNTGDANEEVAGFKSVTLKDAGTLSSYISNEDKYNITSLKIKGNINSDDISFIRDMAGFANDGTSTKGQLIDLDLSESGIESGGNGFYTFKYNGFSTEADGYITTQTFDNEVPNNIFTKTILERLILPATITSMGDYAFWGSNLTSVTILSDFTIGNRNPFGRSNIEFINVPDNHSSLSSIDGVLYNKTGETLIAIPGNKKVTSYPNTLKKLGKYAFCGSLGISEIELPIGITEIPYGCFYMSNVVSVVIPEGVTRIDDDGFQKCYNLSSISLPKSLTSIGAYSLGNTNLKQLTIPSNVSLIQNAAFWETFLTEIYCMSSIPPECKGVFQAETYNNCIVYVPASNINTYKTSESWKDFLNIQTIEE